MHRNGYVMFEREARDFNHVLISTHLVIRTNSPHSNTNTKLASRSNIGTNFKCILMTGKVSSTGHQIFFRALVRALLKENETGSQNTFRVRVNSDNVVRQALHD